MGLERVQGRRRIEDRAVDAEDLAAGAVRARVVADRDDPRLPAIAERDDADPVLLALDPPLGLLKLMSCHMSRLQGMMQ